ncbi:1-phosphofructokinase [Halanaerobacter jeridensis]|uniref:Tagatose-6-phosphate kinase n=1 Tax=Halanaerobacter jeridensis TaxID=706427 RepID=A0A938XQK4_9FIRM|nr:1-phosphofructokinase [Halanaerobacter jeridensis]MBM7558058.1 1-phosphofructokinase [Halanaerobacter jeridensis]
MISTVTINPAVDYSLKADEIKLDKVNRVDFLAKSAAGKGINVAKAVKKLGQEPQALGCVGGVAGQYIVDELKKQEITTDFNWVENETRINFKVIDNLNQETKINQHGLPLTESELEKIFAKIIEQAQQSEILILGGSLPENTPVDFYQKVIAELNGTATKVFLDTSEEALKLALKSKPTLIKPNLRELEEIEGQELSFQEVISVSQDLVTSGIETVVVSMGADGALLVTEKDVCYARPPQVEVVSTVGAGDSMVGALAVAYAKNYSAQKKLKFAVAMSVATILSPGSEVANLVEVKKWMKEVKVKQVEG